jgi:NAD(P)-dependent dehydrogenase (short-subunit alcohol dehydrogenase family)
MAEMTRVTTPFDFDSTAAEVIEGINLSGKRAIVTGASSGIGVETARALAGAGAEVTLAVRDASTGERVAADIAAATGNDALGLHDALAAGGDARIVSLSSRGHLRSPVVFDDVNFGSRPYDRWLAYGQSKTANVLFAVEANRRGGREGITANAVHPGAISTNLSRHMTAGELEQLAASGLFRYKTIEQGAATSVLVASSPLLDGIGGRYFEDCNEAEVIDPTDSEQDPRSGVAAYALDADNALRLWDVSLEFVG